MTSIETREVLADAYYRHGTRMLKHAVEVDSMGQVMRVLCERVSRYNLADRYASDPHAAPTCETCIRRANNLRATLESQESR